MSTCSLGEHRGAQRSPVALRLWSSGALEPYGPYHRERRRCHGTLRPLSKDESWNPSSPDGRSIALDGPLRRSLMRCSFAGTKIHATTPAKHTVCVAAMRPSSWPHGHKTAQCHKPHLYQMLHRPARHRNRPPRLEFVAAFLTFQGQSMRRSPTLPLEHQHHLSPISTGPLP
ncbi:hypothetical protein BS50DRAFT_240985 [Corynespora cassiicola Philippines]|uniref:Uncharacterized protein n=1 Tax=Corynespora cassiicola Philippines TaxID=1448308 RepID=A0A2T2P2Z8_CORCC|nr:hypothetical protein BS50DRAFT_240985 [Corynespora cassiicola Philippines]